MLFRYFAVISLMSIGLCVHAADATGKKNKPAATVYVEKAVIAPIADPIEALGTLRANETVDITVHFAEFVNEILFSEGQRVTEGDVLLTLESTEEQAQLQEAQYTLQESLRQLERIKAIAGRGDASQALLDERQREYNVAKARFTVIQSQLRDHSVIAPFTGLIGLRNVSPGAYVAPGDVVTTLIDDNTMKLDFSIPAVFLNSLKIGMPLTATTRAFPDAVFNGSVTALDNRIDLITRTITVRAVLPNPEGKLKPGLLMEIVLHKDQRQALLISEEALVPRAQKHFVMVVTQDIAKQQEVSVGSRLNGKVEITAGLNANDTVVTHGADKIRSNSSVKIAPNTHQSTAGGL